MPSRGSAKWSEPMWATKRDSSSEKNAAAQVTSFAASLQITFSGLQPHLNLRRTSRDSIYFWISRLLAGFHRDATLRYSGPPGGASRKETT